MSIQFSCGIRLSHIAYMLVQKYKLGMRKNLTLLRNKF